MILGHEFELFIPISEKFEPYGLPYIDEGTLEKGMLRSSSKGYRGNPDFGEHSFFKNAYNKRIGG